MGSPLICNAAVQWLKASYILFLSVCCTLRNYLQPMLIPWVFAHLSHLNVSDYPTKKPQKIKWTDRKYEFVNHFLFTEQKHSDKDSHNHPCVLGKAFINWANLYGKNSILMSINLQSLFNFLYQNFVTFLLPVNYLVCSINMHMRFFFLNSDLF